MHPTHSYIPQALQTQTLTPEARASLVARASASRDRVFASAAAVRSVRAVQEYSSVSFSSASAGLRSVRDASAPAAYGGAGGAAARVSALANATDSVRHSFAAVRRATPVAIAHVPTPAAAAGAAALEDAAADLAVVAAAPMAAAGAADFATLLEQLRREPADDELAAKFAIFEEYSATVSEVRTGFTGAIEAHRATLPPAVVSSTEAELKKLDAEGGGAEEGAAGCWFVFHMMRVAGNNHARLSALLHGLETKLRLLADADVDCPMCLCAVGAEHGRPAKLLGCCHRTCEECWANWVQVRAGAPLFCPLCMQPQFLEALATAVM